MICELTAIRAPTLTGAMSPYPTVPSVTTVKYRDAGLSRAWLKLPGEAAEMLT